jgi:hypothetical protein
MTNIDEIKRARMLMDLAIKSAAGEMSALTYDCMIQTVDRLVYLQAEALRQATEVADENFARAQKLSEQVQENVRHIERLAERRSDEDRRIVEALDAVATLRGTLELHGLDQVVDAALALAKGEAV